MKIKNFINIKVGNKSIDFHNLILDEYLKRFVNTQLDVTQNDYAKQDRLLDCIFLKFDTVLDFNAQSEINMMTDFDTIMLSVPNPQQLISDRRIEIKYNFNDEYGFTDLELHKRVDISHYYGRKITAIGFNAIPGSPQLAGYVCSILDTSNYNLYFQENENFVLTRRDVITTDADFWCNDSRIKGPIHLTVSGGPSLLYQDRLEKTTEGGTTSYAAPANSFAQLYSVGFSSYKDFMAEEFIIGTDITAINNGTSINLNGIENKLSDYLRYANSGIYPNSSIYPLKANYKYIIYKYKLFQEIYTRNPDYVEGGEEPEFIGTWTDTGVYYLQSLPLNKVGNIDLTIKYERSN